MKSLRAIVNTKKILIAAHRGNSNNFPENTIAAFQSAVNLGADMIELDVQFTKDKQIVVYHNEILRNDNQLISELTFNEIKNIDNGSWFSNDFANERIPLLVDVIKEFHAQIYFSVEVKPFFSTQTKTELTQLVALLVQNNLTQNIVIASFDTKNLSYIKSINPQIYTAAIFDCRLKNNDKLNNDDKLEDGLKNENKLNNGLKFLPIDYKNECGCDAIICSLDELDEEFATNATENNIFIGIYGAETKNDIDKCLANNVKVIGTNFPARIVQLINETL
jgi:glycerophosphoryl diester phosphodiesterase